MALSMGSVAKYWSSVSAKQQSYSWEYQVGDSDWRSRSRKAALMWGQRAAGRLMRCQEGPPSVHSWWN